MTAGRSLSFCWWGIALLSLAGLGLATYLAVAYLSGHAPACGPVGECEQVTTSRYAVFLDIPVALLGVAMYGLLLMGSLTALALGRPPSVLRYALLLVSGAGVGFSAYLTGIELLVLHAICIYCVASAALVTLIFALAGVSMFLGRSTRAEPSPPIVSHPLAS